MTITGVIAGLVTLVFGGFLTFAGQRLFRILLPIWGFIFGFWISEAIAAALLGNSSVAVIVGWLAGLAGGLILAALAYFLFKFGVVMLAATFGYFLVSVILDAVGVDSGIVVPILSIVGAVAFGLLAWFGSFERIIVIIATALIGASLMVIGLLFITGRLPVEAFRAGLSALSLSLEFAPLWIALFLILAVAGALTQLMVGGRSGDESETEEISDSADEATEDQAILEEPAAADDRAADDPAAMDDDLAMTGAAAGGDAVTAPEPVVMDDQAIMEDLEAMDDLEPPPGYDDIT